MAKDEDILNLPRSGLVLRMEINKKQKNKLHNPFLNRILYHYHTQEQNLMAQTIREIFTRDFILGFNEVTLFRFFSWIKTHHSPLLDCILILDNIISLISWVSGISRMIPHKRRRFGIKKVKAA